MNKRRCQTVGFCLLLLSLLPVEWTEHGGIGLGTGLALAFGLLALGTLLLLLGGVLTAGQEKSARASGTGSDAGAQGRAQLK